MMPLSPPNEEPAMTVDTLDSPTKTTDTPSPATRGRRLAVGGWVRHPLWLDATALEAMEWVPVSDFDVVCTLDGSHGILRPVRTVRLCDLIAQAEPAFEKRTDFKRVAIVAEGEECYRALFSWAEIFNSPLGSGIVVAYDIAGARLPANAGSFALLARHDLATGPRYVRGLRSIEVHKLW
jgi:hypothetical protein